MNGSEQGHSCSARGADPTEVYEAALEGILVDGAVTRKERLVLDALVAKLGLDPDEARLLEETVVVRLAASD